MKLAEVLPDLVADLEAPLAHLGRAEVATQLRDAEFIGWRYDEFADAVYVDLLPDEPTETLSLYDELGVNLDLDARGRVCRLEVLHARELAQRLDNVIH